MVRTFCGCVFLWRCAARDESSRRWVQFEPHFTDQRRARVAMTRVDRLSVHSERLGRPGRAVHDGCAMFRHVLHNWIVAGRGGMSHGLELCFAAADANHGLCRRRSFGPHLRERRRHVDKRRQVGDPFRYYHRGRDPRAKSQQQQQRQQ